MVKKVLITPRSFQESGIPACRLLKERGFETIINDTGMAFTEEQMIEKCAGADGIIVGIDPVTEKVLKSSHKLRAVSKYGAGLDNIDLEAARKLGISVERAAGTNATSVAELAIGLMFTLARDIPYSAGSTRKGGWDRKKGVEITGKTLGILGLGCIGREVARMADGLGMKISAYDPFVNANDVNIIRYGIEMTGVEEILRNSDFITLHMPLTDETKHMINRKALEKMKSAAYLINTSRGELVEENDLYNSLVNGVIAGAAEDVFSKEPPGEHRLLSLDNFILTSHIGAFTKEANEKMAMASAVNLLRMLENES